MFLGKKKEKKKLKGQITIRFTLKFVNVEAEKP